MMQAIRLTHIPTAAEFRDRAEPFLLQHEAANNQLLGVIGNLLAAPERYPEQPYLAVVEDDGAVIAAAVRTPPHNLLLALSTSQPALELIAQDALALYPQFPNTNGPQPTVQNFAEAITALTGMTARAKLAMWTYQLAHVTHPSSVSGRYRMAGLNDKDLLVQWRLAFSREALGTVGDEAQITDTIEFILRNSGPTRGIGVWEDGGRVVSMAAHTGPTPNGIRIGGVYTPPESRGRGYASACVAALSQMLLDGGRKFVFLFTDLTNPTSNKIYQQIGYEPVCGAADIEFVV